MYFVLSVLNKKKKSPLLVIVIMGDVKIIRW